ncbi:TonB-dependent receptor [Croceicoccus sp. F390]|uniref:TonB-dependent receptor n=1 Tax=Croceicoccus esteveae TaxID=3075597 RepID=A0ABU2ZF11_9SPHN|nr:TonB-dependent receptor [Croceicoccus sp. F390]MDT0575187.1 TonB-dependent receptor [Croceicoccus sp. F390]
MKTWNLYSAAASVIAMVAASAPAIAQTSPADQQVRLDEIVVTAQKQEQRLQDVPISIAAFDEAALETNRIEGFEDLAQFTPGLYAVPSAADSNGLRFTIRGVGVTDPQLGLDSKVALYVDGLYIGKTPGLAFDSPDIARIEILKGPQGTLYGRNAVAGAINIIPARPQGGEIFGEASAEYGRFNEMRFDTAVNMPAGEFGGIRVSGIYAKRDGWVENTGLGKDLAAYERYGGRIAFGADLTPALRVDVAGDYSESRNTPYYYQYLAGTAAPNAIFAPAIQTFSGRNDEVNTSFDVEDGLVKNYGFVTRADWDWAEDHQLSFVGGWRGADARRAVALAPDANIAVLNGILNADLDQNPANGSFSINDTFRALPSLLSIIGVDVRPDYFVGAPPAAVTGLFTTPPGGAPTLDDHEQYSLELTANGSFADDRFEYTAGLYYFNEDTSTGEPTIRFGDGQEYLSLLPVLGPALTGLGLLGALQTPGLPPEQQAALLQQAQAQARQAAAILGGARLSSSNFLTIDTEAYAAYARLTWNLTERLRLIGGLRYSTETKSAFNRTKSPFFFDDTDLLGRPILPNIINDRDFDSFDPSFIVEFEPRDDMLIYASRSESFRSGGFNAVALAPRIEGETFGSDFLFDNEEITAYEVGIKSDLFDRRLRFNAAGYFYQLTNEQTSIILDIRNPVARSVVNADTDIWGGEVELAYALTQGLTIAGNYSYTDGDADPLINPLTGVAEARPNLFAAPKNSYALSADYRGTMNSRTDFFAHVDFNHKDSTELTTGAFLTNQNLVNMRVGLELETKAGGSVYLAGWAQNLTDDKYTIDSINFSSFAGEVVVYGTPRTYGVTVGTRF